MNKVVVGLSGGVDSSVAAYLLKQQGYEVVGLFMKNWDDASVTLTSSCTWEDDWLFAQQTAKKLGIEIHFIDLSKHYKERVVEYMFDEYSKGRTPNPDVLCNREIKFDLFIDEARKLGADYIATGHYCRKLSIDKENRTIHRLLAGKDNNKDQSYFLCQLSQKQLENVLFPIGELTKPEVREIAEKNKLFTATRKDSQGICFVGKVDLPIFLQQKLDAKEGNIVEIPFDFYSDINKDKYSIYNYIESDGKVVGKHKGAHFYTNGQRKGLNVGGTGEPLYVIATNIETNTVYVGRSDKHPGLYREGIIINQKEAHWIREDLKLEVGSKKDFLVRIRYRQPLQLATLIATEDELKILFEKPQRGIAAGQFAAWYSEEELIGSGVISK